MTARQPPPQGRKGIRRKNHEVREARATPAPRETACAARVVEVEIPHRFNRWFQGPKAIVTIAGDLVTLPGGAQFVVRPCGDEQYVCLHPQLMTQVGVITKHTVKQSLTNDLLVKLGLIRSALLGVPYPTPVAYVTRLAGSLVHPGDCFRKQGDPFTKRVKYTATDDQRCQVCGRPFV